MKKIIFTIALLFVVLINSYAQVGSNGFTTDNGISGQNAFFDASTSFDPSTTFDNTNGKGLVFPRTDLTTWSFNLSLFGSGTFPTGLDGMIVYNIGSGATLITGNNPSVSSTVAPGFYYFSNPSVDPDNFSPSVSSGTWIAIGGSGGGGAYTITDGTPVDTNTINVAEDQEKVVSLVGAADGSTTYIDLGTTNLGANVVKQFRRANIYDAAGKLVLTASGDYDVATNVFVTGNGFMNLLLPAAADYTVELYYTAN